MRSCYCQVPGIDNYTVGVLEKAAGYSKSKDRSAGVFVVEKGGPGSLSAKVGVMVECCGSDRVRLG